MTEDQKKYVESLEEMFATEGWKVLVNDLTGSIAQLLQKISDGVPSEEYHHTVGRISSFRLVLNLPTMVEHYKNEADKEEAGLDALP